MTAVDRREALGRAVKIYLEKVEYKRVGTEKLVVEWF